MSSRIHVGLTDRPYDILIGAALSDHLDEALAACGNVTHTITITDDRVKPLHAEPLAALLEDRIGRSDMISVASGEQTKSLRQFAELCQQLLDLGADRKTLIVACGGGVVGDLAGYVAASFARGLRFMQAPTTLLAQVDSSVGGKTGVNLPAAKNMVGAFWQPTSVLISIDALKTLGDRDYRAGLAEVVKYGVIQDEAFFAKLEQSAAAINQRDPQVLEEVVARCCRLKADVVEGDEREETGLRAILNYGHTFCHALEAVTDYGHFLHGEAVAIGMLCASTLAERLGRISSDVTERQHQLLTELQLPTQFHDLDIDGLMAAMMRDKKVSHGKLRFILPTRMGHVELVDDVPAEDVIAAWETWRA